MAEPYCHAAQDGDCAWTGCPQLSSRQSHCPLDKGHRYVAEPTPGAGPMTRYRLTRTMRYGGHYGEEQSEDVSMEPHPEGEYVRFAALPASARPTAEQIALVEDSPADQLIVQLLDKLRRWSDGDDTDKAVIARFEAKRWELIGRPIAVTGKDTP
jgi:hypothetical protein